MASESIITIENENNREADTENIQQQNTQKQISVDSSVSQFNAIAAELQNIQARLHRSIHEGRNLSGFLLIYHSLLLKHPFFYLTALIEYQNILMQADVLYSDLQREVNQLCAEKEEAEQSHRIRFSLVNDDLAALRAKLEELELKQELYDVRNANTEH